MKAYIDKSALIAELNRLIAELVEEGKDTMFEQGRISAFKDVKVFINHTLEVKEVDLKKELSYEDYIRFFEEHPNFPDDWGFDECWVFAEYFYKLGLKAPEQALAAVEIAKEEMITKACEWLREHKDYVATEDNGISGWIPECFIEEFKKAMEE